jgi:hypothetical protein
MTGRGRELSAWERYRITSMCAEGDHTRPFSDNAAMDSRATAERSSDAP